MNFQVRVTREFSEEIVNRASQIAAYGSCTEWFVYEHEADAEVNRTHCHMYFFNYGLKEDSFRNHFKVVFPDIDKKDFAISATAGRRKGPITFQYAIKYASKDGTLTVKHVRGFSIESVQKIEAEYKNREVIPAKAVEPRQMTKWRLVEICLAEKKQEEKQRGVTLSKYDTAQLVTQILVEHKQVFSSHKVIEICETMAAHEGNFNMLDHIVNSLRY